MLRKNIKTIYGNIKYYEKGSGMPLIMLSGYAVPFPGSEFYELIEKLSTHFRCIVIEFFGYGNSDIVSQKTNFAFNLKLLNNLIRQITKEKYYLLGHSLGSFYTLSHAVDNLDQLQGIILLDSYPKYGWGALFTYKLFIEQFMRFNKKRWAKLSDQKLTNMLYQKRNLPEELIQEGIAIAKIKYLNKNIRQEIWTVPRVLKAHLKNVPKNQLPVLAFCRNETYKTSKWLKTKFPKMKITNFKKTNHFLHHNFSQEISEQIIQNFAN